MTKRDAVGRVVAVLERLAGRPGGEGVRELATALGLAPATAHRYLTRLAEHGLVARRDEGRYHLTSRLFVLGVGAGGARDLDVAGRAALERMASSTGETACLMVRDAERSVCVDKVESRHDLRIRAQVGSRGDLRLGSTGPVLLAHAPAEVRHRVLASPPLEARTDRTITEREAIEAMLERIRVDGYHVSRGQVTDGVMGVAAPVRGRDGAVVATLAVVAPESRLARSDVLDRAVRVVVSEARTLSDALGSTTLLAEAPTRVAASEP